MCVCVCVCVCVCAVRKYKLEGACDLPPTYVTCRGRSVLATNTPHKPERVGVLLGVLAGDGGLKLLVYGA